MIDRRAFFSLLPGVAAAVAAKAEADQIPPEVIRKAWVAGTREQRRKYRETHGAGNWPLTEPQDVDFAGSEHEAGMRAATEVILAWIAGR
jgi:hypothetical protein